MDPILDFPLERGDGTTSSYLWWRDNRPSIEAAISRWYAETHADPSKGKDPIAHIEWRILRAHDRWGRTLGQVLEASWPKSGPDPLPPVTTMRGNFLAAKGYELARMGDLLAFQYAGMSKLERTQFRAAYRAQGWDTLPMSAWDDWGQRNQRGDRQTYDYLTRMDEFRDEFVRPLQADGIRVVMMGLTERPGAGGMVLSQAKRLLDQVMPPLADDIGHWCAGWEVQQDLLPSYDDNLAVLRHMRPMVQPGGLLTWQGGTQRWGAIDKARGIDEHDFWRDADCDGLLYQLPSDWDVEEIEFDLFELKPISGTKGIVGRVVDLFGKRFFLFETVRTSAEHAQVRQMLATRDDPRVSGFG